MKKYHLKIKPNGDLEFLGFPPPGLKVPVMEARRFSEIVPVNVMLCLAFRILRRVFGEGGRIAGWTRQWPCRWRATILLGPERGARLESMDRRSLIRWEFTRWANHGRGEGVV